MAANSSSEMILRWRRSSSSMRRSRISAGPAAPPRPGTTVGCGGAPAAGGAPGPRRRSRQAPWGAGGRRRGSPSGHHDGDPERGRVARTLGLGGRPPTAVAEQLLGHRLGAAPAGELVDLPVDHPLHGRRPADELEHDRVVLALHVDEQAARRDTRSHSFWEKQISVIRCRRICVVFLPNTPRRTTMRVVVSTMR